MLKKYREIFESTKLEQEEQKICKSYGLKSLDNLRDYNWMFISTYPNNEQCEVLPA